MTIADKTVLVTGFNRGIGQALVAEAQQRRQAGVCRHAPAALMALAALLLTPASSISKSAAFSLTQSLWRPSAGRRRTSSRSHVRPLAGSWRSGAAKVLERQNAALAHVQPVTAEAKEGAKADPPSRETYRSGTHSDKGDETR